MLRLMGILAIGNWMFGRRRRALRRSLFLGALLGFLAHNDFDADRVEKRVKKTAKDVKKAVKKAKKEIREARRATREASREAIHAEIEARRAARKERHETIREEIAARRAAREEHRRIIHDELAARKVDRWNVCCTEPMNAADVSSVAQENQKLVNDLERNARFAAMMVNVPTIHFPEDDPKYNSSQDNGPSSATGGGPICAPRAPRATWTVGPFRNLNGRCSTLWSQLPFD